MSDATAIYQQRIADSREVYQRFSAQFRERDCPICGKKSKKPESKFDERYQIVRCDWCNSAYVDPCPSYAALDYYYNQCKCNAIYRNLLKGRARKKGLILTERSKFVLNLIKDLITENPVVRILEVGCNSGAFLHELRDVLEHEGLLDVVDLSGIDIDSEAIMNPVARGLNLTHSSAEDFFDNTNQRFDLIVHFEVIEHLQDPYRFMQAVAALLKDGGVTYFQTPNGLGLDNLALSYNDFRPNAHSIFPPMHLQAFSTQNITHFLLRCGLKVEEISTPGNFDVDIVRHFVRGENEFSIINQLPSEEQLAIVQQLLRLLTSSSHLAVRARK